MSERSLVMISVCEQAAALGSLIPIEINLPHSIESLEEPQTTTTKGMENSICHGSSIFNIHYTLIPA